MDCKYCLNKYSRALYPVELSCGDILCKGCINFLAKRNRRSCPICDNEIYMPEPDHAINEKLSQLITPKSAGKKRDLLNKIETYKRLIENLTSFSEYSTKIFNYVSLISLASGFIKQETSQIVSSSSFKKLEILRNFKANKFNDFDVNVLKNLKNGFEKIRWMFDKNFFFGMKMRLASSVNVFFASESVTFLESPGMIYEFAIQVIERDLDLVSVGICIPNTESGAAKLTKFTVIDNNSYFVPGLVENLSGNSEAGSVAYEQYFNKTRSYIKLRKLTTYRFVFHLSAGRFMMCKYPEEFSVDGVTIKITNDQRYSPIAYFRTR